MTRTWYSRFGVTQAETAMQTGNRQRNVWDHRYGLHAERLKGCPYCYSPGPDGEYRGTTWADLGQESLIG